MLHLDEGVAHAYLDGALDRHEHDDVERHIASCADCAARVAEARGYIAAATQVLGKLDTAPAGGRAGTGAMQRTMSKVPPRRWFSPQMMAAASLAVVAVSSWLVLRDRAELQSAPPPVVQTPAAAPAPTMAPPPSNERPTPSPAARTAPPQEPKAEVSAALADAPVEKRAARDAAPPSPQVTALSERAPRTLNSFDPRAGRRDSISVQRSRPTARQVASAEGAPAMANAIAPNTLSRRAAMVDSMVNVFSGCYNVTRGERAVEEGFPSRISLLTRAHRRVGDNQTWIATQGTTVPPSVVWEWSLDAAFQVVVTRVPDGVPLTTTFTSEVRADVLLRRTDCR